MNIFSYESKVSQILMFTADLIILNVCFLLCCIPVFTIGAAQAALYSGIRVLLDKEDDSSPVKAFFKAFPQGFKQITLAWIAPAALCVLLVYATMMVTTLATVESNAPVWMSFVGLALAMLFTTQIPLFHARFTCSVKQLWRNSTILLILNPFRCILVTGFTWLPAVFLMAMPYLFMMSTPAWALMYYSVVFMLNFYIMRKPFNKFIQDATQPKEEEAEAEETEEATEE